MKCPDCEELFTGNTAEEVMQNMHPHYTEAHKDIMATATKEKMAAWMKQFHADFEAAPEIE